MPRNKREPILNEAYWRGRIEQAKYEHQAVYKCTLGEWQAIEAKHRNIIAKNIKPGDRVVDAGCGWGRLIELMPQTWTGDYVGVDLSPDFIKIAAARYPRAPGPVRHFIQSDLRALAKWELTKKFDWAVLISIKYMIIRNCGQPFWEEVEAGLKHVANNILYLEYDVNDEGEVHASVVP